MGANATVMRSKATTLTDGRSLKARNAEAWHFATNPYVALTSDMVQVLVARPNLTASSHVVHADAQTSAALLDITA